MQVLTFRWKLYYISACLHLLCTTVLLVISQELRPYCFLLSLLSQILTINLLLWSSLCFVFQSETGSSLVHRCYWVYVTEVLIDRCGHIGDNWCSSIWDKVSILVFCCSSLHVLLYTKKKMHFLPVIYMFMKLLTVSEQFICINRDQCLWLWYAGD